MSEPLDPKRDACRNCGQVNPVCDERPSGSACCHHCDHSSPIPQPEQAADSGECGDALLNLRCAKPRGHDGVHSDDPPPDSPARKAAERIAHGIGPICTVAYIEGIVRVAYAPLEAELQRLRNHISACETRWADGLDELAKANAG